MLGPSYAVIAVGVFFGGSVGWRHRVRVHMRLDRVINLVVQVLCASDLGGSGIVLAVSIVIKLSKMVAGSLSAFIH